MPCVTQAGRMDGDAAPVAAVASKLAMRVDDVAAPACRVAAAGQDGVGARSR